MFLSYIKDFTTKKIVKNSLSNVKLVPSANVIETVGIIFDETYFQEKDAVIAELVANGIREDYIRILVFRDRIKKNETFSYPVFSHKDLSWTANIEKPEVKGFTGIKFDLLINYYDTEKTALLLVSHQSKAAFKAGFASIDKRINHFMIDTNAEKHKIFIEELVKYLKILNKL